MLSNVCPLLLAALFALQGSAKPASREIRIVTNLCVYWDEIFMAGDADSPEVKLTPLDAAVADLHFRGYVSLVSQWNPTPGLYTRYGDVRELLEQIDGRLVDHGLWR